MIKNPSITHFLSCSIHNFRWLQASILAAAFLVSATMVRAQRSMPVRHTGAIEVDLATEHGTDFVSRLSENDTTYFSLGLEHRTLHMVLYRPENFGLADPTADFYIGHEVGAPDRRVTMRVNEREFILWYRENGKDMKLGPYSELKADLDARMEELAVQPAQAGLKAANWLRKVGNYAIFERGEALKTMQAMAEDHAQEKDTPTCATDPSDAIHSTGKVSADNEVANTWVGKRHVWVSIWVYDDSFSDRSDVEYIILDALSSNHADAQKYYLLQDIYVIVQWSQLVGGQEAMHTAIPWSGDAETFIGRWRTWLAGTPYNSPDEIHMLATEASWGSTLGMAYTGTFNGGNASYTVGIACDNFSTVMAHEISHVLGAAHTDYWYDGWWHAGLMYYAANYWADQKDHHCWSSSFESMHGSMNKIRKYPDKIIDLGTIDGNVNGRSWSGSTVGESPADHFGRSNHETAINKVYKFRVNRAGGYLLDIQNADYDTYLYLINGQTGALITKDDDGGAGLWSQTQWVWLSPGVEYVGVVSGYGQSVGYYGNFIIWSHYALSGTAKDAPVAISGLQLPPEESTSDRGYSEENKSLAFAAEDGEPDFRLFPNPAQSTVHVAMDGIDPKSSVRIQMTDLMGRMVLQQDVAVHSQVMSLDVSKLAAGSYLISLVDGHRGIVRSRKFLKE